MTLTTRLAVAMILLVAIAVTAVGWLSFRSIEQALLPRILDRIEAHSRLLAIDLQSQVRGARGDIAGFRAAAALNGLIRAHLAGGTDPVDGLSEKSWHDQFAQRLLAELEAKPAYAQFRVIGIEDGGREIVRVDRSGPDHAIRLVPEAELQRKGDRGYFKDTISLPANAIYVSALDLNQENGVIEVPHVPTLRIATPLMGPDGKPFGIVIINIDMRPAFDRVRSSVRQGGEIYVVNKRGDYLVHPDPTREFGSDLGTPTNWQKDFPDLAPSLGASDGVARIVPDETGKLGGEALAPALLAGNEWVGVIETFPNAVFVAPAAAIRNSSIRVGLIAVLFAAALAVVPIVIMAVYLLIAQRFGAACLATETTRGPAAARNLGAKCARGDVLLFRQPELFHMTAVSTLRTVPLFSQCRDSELEQLSQHTSIDDVAQTIKDKLPSE